MSDLEKTLNKIVVLILLLQLVIAVLASTINYLSKPTYKAYVTKSLDGLTENLVICVNYFLLLNTMLPLSLMVTLEVMKVIQCQFMRWDVQLFDEKRGIPLSVSSSGLIEELGQVSYLFSDKTGTITRNEMRFKACAVGVQQFGETSDQEFDFASHKVHFAGVLNETEESVESHPKQWSQSKKRKEFLKLLCIAQECLAEPQKDGKGFIYRGASVDEVTLLDFCQTIGLACIVSEDDGVVLSQEDLTTVKYRVYRKFSFSSDRKRMSVLFQDPQDGLIKLFTKGADEALVPRLAQEQCYTTVENTERFINNASKVGLRTIMTGVKILS